MLTRRELPGFAIENEKKRTHPWDTYYQFSLKLYSQGVAFLDFFRSAHPRLQTETHTHISQVSGLRSRNYCLELRFEFQRSIVCTPVSNVTLRCGTMVLSRKAGTEDRHIRLLFWDTNLTLRVRSSTHQVTCSNITRHAATSSFFFFQVACGIF